MNWKDIFEMYSHIFVNHDGDFQLINCTMTLVSFGSIYRQNKVHTQNEKMINILKKKYILIFTLLHLDCYWVDFLFIYKNMKKLYIAIVVQQFVNCLEKNNWFSDIKVIMFLISLCFSFIENQKSFFFLTVEMVVVVADIFT